LDDEDVAKVTGKRQIVRYYL